jgi:enoyl-CoA hydratase/carnithine racemase
MNEHVRIERDGEIAIVTLDRPDQLNAFTGSMGRGLGSAYASCDEDDDVRVVVVTGAGRAFCAGADVSGGGDTFRAPGAGFTSSPVTPPAWDVRKPVIAAINGHAVGIGLTIAMQCDIRLVADDATLAFVHVRRGVLPDMHAHWTVPRTIGFARATELFLTGRSFTGREAAELGIATRALPAPEVLPAALAMAREIAEQTAPLSVALSKRLLWSEVGRDGVGRLETEFHLHLMGGDDAREGVTAYVERRAPSWRQRVPTAWPHGVD